MQRCARRADLLRPRRTPLPPAEAVDCRAGRELATEWLGLTAITAGDLTQIAGRKTASGVHEAAVGCPLAQQGITRSCHGRLLETSRQAYPIRDAGRSRRAMAFSKGCNTITAIA
jgi:hypothetical protein